MRNLLEIANLTVNFDSDAGEIQAVDHINLNIRSGEVVALVGESGSGKSVTAFAILRLIRRPGRVRSGTIHFNGIDLSVLTEEEMFANAFDDIVLDGDDVEEQNPKNS